MFCPGSSGNLRLACFLCVYCLCRPCYASCSSAPKRNDVLFICEWKTEKRVWSDCDMTGSSCWIRPVSMAVTGQSVESAPLQIKSLKFSRILVLFIHVESNLLARPYAHHRTVMQTGWARASARLKGQMLIFMLTSRRRIHRLHMQTEVCWLWTGGRLQILICLSSTRTREALIITPTVENNRKEVQDD